MAKTRSNVLVGVATLSVRRPDDAIAEWSTLQQHAGDRSVRLYKKGSGNDGSTHFQMTPPTGITMAAWTLAVATNSFWHHLQALTANWIQMEFRFEDPDSQAWAEITAVPLQGALGTGAWVQQVLANGDNCGYGGVGELGASFFNWGPLTAANLVEAAILGEAAVTDPAPWILSRVRLELWEAAPERTCYVDTIEVMGVTYTIEPGGTAPAMALSSPFVEVGYTEDGVTIEHNVDEADIEVEEEVVPVDRVITKQTMSVTCNMAESTLENMAHAMAGSVLSGNILTLGGGVNQKVNLKIEGRTPAGFLRAIQIPLATATGAVGMSYKKGTKTMVPVTFQALRPGNGLPACTIVDNAV